MTNNPKAIFFDLDGTIINGNGGPFPGDLRLMEEAVKAGHRLFINTGRSFSNIPEIVLDLPLWSGAAAGGGAHVLLACPDTHTTPGKKPEYKTIYHKWVDEKHLCDICAWYLKSGKLLILEGEKDCYIVNPSKQPFVSPSAKIVTKADDFYTRYAGDFITKITMNADISLQDRELLEVSFKINIFTYYSEGILKGEDKAKALGILLEAAGIKRENSIAVGDGINDIDMLRYAGMGVAMGNACPEVKAAAGAITGNCGENGVAEMLRRFVLG